LSNAGFVELQRVAGSVSRETFERLQAFEQLFLKWNRRINLVAGSTEGDLWRRHVLDSVQLARLEPRATRWVDIGSGGGFPGLVLAFVLAERGGSIDLIESNRKKAAFLQTAVGAFGLPARVIAQRIDASYALAPTPDVVTARALASLQELLELAAPWLLSGARALFHKGRDYRQEIEESAHRWRFDLVEHRSLIDSDSVVLDIRNLRRA
jgi:16S rRNA (guanine527-N7)-methyltransferase